MDGIRHTCSTWWGRLGLLGGIIVVLACMMVGPWMLLVPEASTCVQPFTLAQGQNPTVANWNANPAYMCTLWNNGIDDTNVVAGANIAQSKIAGLLTNTVFSDHSARHEPAGADEVGDIDILNTGTKLSLHGARHSPDTGADQIPGLTGIIGTRHKYVADAGLQGNVPFTNYLVGPYSSGPVTNWTPKGVVYCGAFVYVLIDDTNGPDQNIVLKITASTMALSATINLAAAGVTPVAIVCGADDSVYTLSTNSGTVDTTKLEKITTAGAVSTLADFNVQNLDGVVAMISDPLTANLYVIGQDNTIINDRLLIQVTSGGSVTSVQDGGDATDDFGDLFFLNRNGVDNIGVLRADRTAFECHVRVYTTASPPALLSTITVTGAWSGAANQCRAAEFDGSHLWVAVDSSVGSSIAVVDMASLTVSSANDIEQLNSDPAATPETMFHDGRNVNVADTGTLVYVLQPYQLLTGGTTKRAGWNFTGGVGTTSCGIAGDGVSLYVCSKTGATAFIITKQLAL